MNNWVIFVTVWIIWQTCAKASEAPVMAELTGKNKRQTMSLIFGSVLWGVFMLSALYMAGLYRDC